MKLTPEYLESLIQEETYLRPGGGTLTICVLTLQGGVTVTGESNVITPDNFDAAIGQKMAREKAVDAMWPLEGYYVKRAGSELLIRAARAAHAAIRPGWDDLHPKTQDAFIECARMAVNMQPDEDIPEPIAATMPEDNAAARFCVVVRAVFGI